MRARVSRLPMRTMMSAIDDFFIKRGVGTVDIPDIEAFDCPTSDINNSPRPSILEDIPMPGMNIYNKEGT